MPYDDADTTWTVANVMTKDVLTVLPSQSLAEAAAVMVERDVGAAMVTDGGTIVGIITERDLLRALARSLIPWDTRVSECMTSDPVTIEPEASAAEAIQEMIRRGFRHLPVMEEGTMVGIVSLRDLVTEMAGSLPL